MSIENSASIEKHSGSKYLRLIHDARSVGTQELTGTAMVDVYSVLEAFNVACPVRQHAIKKLLCAGIRGKGDAEKDLTEARDAISRAIELQKKRM